MKYWVWLILLTAGGATAYLVFSPGSSNTSSKTQTATEEVVKNTEPEQQDTPNIASMGGASTETILPQDAVPKPPKSRDLSDKKAGDADPSDEADDEVADLKGEDLKRERDLLLSPPPGRFNVPTFRNRTRVDTGASATATAAPAFNTAPSGLAASTDASPSGTASPSTSSAPSLGGTFPALPASSATASAGKAVASSTGSSSSTPTFSPSGSSAGTPVPRSQTTDTTVAEAKNIATPPSGTNSLIRPISTILPPPPAPPETQAFEQTAEGAWLDSMKIPAGFNGLVITPNAVFAAMPNNFSSAGEPVTVLGATWKSAFDPNDKPTLQILKDCSDPAVPDCEPHQLPAGSPTILDYLGQDGPGKFSPHTEDQVPDSKDSFEVGTVTLGTGETEVSFHLAPGLTPGKYTVQLFTKDKKLSGSFEVLAPPASMAGPASQPTTQPTTQPTSESYIPRSHKAGVPK